MAANFAYRLKPIQNPYGHGKGPYDSIFQGAGSDTKKTSGAVVAQRLQTLKQNRGQQEKTVWEELARMRSPYHALQDVLHHYNTDRSPGYIRIERLAFESYNETDDLYRAVERYRKCYGHYPQRVLADKIYRNRQTLAYCKKCGIRLAGPALGKPSKNQALTKLAKAQEYQDSCDRNEVEGVFGTVKTAYGLGRIAARLKTTAFCTIGVALILMNLTKRLRYLFRLFYSCLLRIDYLLCPEAASPFREVAERSLFRELLIKGHESQIYSQK